ncbi:MAG: hypothetical protein HC794_07645 [Nitrospiraceae bacterium]|nr:hypothetical protein [Nitrospiraceae bacterium]
MPTLELPDVAINGHATPLAGRLTGLLAQPSPLTPVVPDDAPFTPGQKQWLSGLLTGLSVPCELPPRHARKGTLPPAVAAPAVSLTILYGSQSGNGEALSKDLRKHASSQGFAPAVRELNDVALSELPSLGRVVIVCSTFGEGDPPDNAKKFSRHSTPTRRRSWLACRTASAGWATPATRTSTKRAGTSTQRLAVLGAKSYGRLRIV